MENGITCKIMLKHQIAHKTKTDKAVELWKSGDTKGALKIFKTFKMGLTKDQKAKISIYHEMLSGNKSFYVMIGYHPTTVKFEAEQVIENQFIKL